MTGGVSLRWRRGESAAGVDEFGNGLGVEEENASKGLERTAVGEVDVERASARARPDGDANVEPKRASSRRFSWATGWPCGDGVRESRCGSSSASGMVNSERTSAVALGGSDTPSETLRLMLGTEAAAAAGLSTRMADSAAESDVDRDGSISESAPLGTRDSLPFIFFSAALPLSGAECRRARELSLLLHGSTSSV